MRKNAVFVLALVVAVSSAGCETLPKKFIRKKKQPAHTAAVVPLDESAYEKKFSNEYYYKTHYTFWKTWHDDMIDDLAGNSKRLRRAAQEAYSHLEQMGRYLKPEKKAELEPLLKELDGYRKKFEEGAYSPQSLVAMRTDLERLRRLVANDFYYDKVKADLEPDVVDLGT